VIIVRELLDELDRNVALLDEARGYTREEFVGEPRRYLLAERCYQLAIQCMIDIANYVASLKQWQRAEDSRESLLLLGRQGVLPTEFAQRIAGMANFRNVLVHAYLGINRNLVYDYLERLDDFRQFARYVELYLDETQ